MRTEETPIANPSEADEDKSLYQFQFGAYGDTNVYVWADSDEAAFEIAVEWVDDHAPGVLTSLDEGDLKAAAEDEGVEWKDSWPDYDDEEFQRVIEAAEADLTVIGHTSLKHGQYIPSWEWHFHEVTDQAEREAVAERAEDDGEQVANGGRSWTHKVVKKQRGGDGKWFAYPAAFTGTEAECRDYAMRFAGKQRGVAGTRIVVESRGGKFVVEVPVVGSHARNGRRVYDYQTGQELAGSPSAGLVLESRSAGGEGVVAAYLDARKVWQYVHQEDAPGMARMGYLVKSVYVD